LRSVRLFKNTDGCTSAMKNVQVVDIENEYLPNHDQIISGEPLIISFSVFLTDQGKFRTEINLTYMSSKTKKEESLNGYFYHEFEIDGTCSEKSVLNFLNDRYRLGIGLQPSNTTSATLERPFIKLSKFIINPYK
jgi:hypothetical protein